MPLIGYENIYIHIWILQKYYMNWKWQLTESQVQMSAITLTFVRVFIHSPKPWCDIYTLSCMILRPFTYTHWLIGGGRSINFANIVFVLNAVVLASLVETVWIVEWQNWQLVGCLWWFQTLLTTPTIAKSVQVHRPETLKTMNKHENQKQPAETKEKITPAVTFL